MARSLPSGSGLPAGWTKEMDKFICHCEALGDVDTKTMILGLKKRFPVLSGVGINPEAIERRIESLELMDNDYFKLGMEEAVKRSEEAGFVLPPMDLEKYGKKNESDDDNDEGTIGLAVSTDEPHGGVKSALKRLSGDLFAGSKLRSANKPASPDHGTAYPPESSSPYKGKEAGEGPSEYQYTGDSGMFAGVRGHGKENVKASSIGIAKTTRGNVVQEAPKADDAAKADDDSTVASSSGCYEGV